jgi:choice-of-anchor B domain-containing protein
MGTVNKYAKSFRSAAGLCLILAAGIDTVAAHQDDVLVPGDHGPPGKMSSLHQRQHDRFFADRIPTQDLDALSAVPCSGGFASIYPCDNVDLLAFMPLNTIGGGQGNDIWGWTDPVTGTEYAILGRSNGTSFVDISDPENAVYVGNLPGHNGSTSPWRDIKVYSDHAYIVSESNGHGLQVFDLNQLRNVVGPPVTFTETAHYGNFGSAHNIAINEATGFGYAVGSNTCAGGLHMVNLQAPAAPTFAGCYSGDGYTHDAQCVIFNGSDPVYVGREICFNSNEDTLTIVDVTDKGNPLLISRTTYPGVGYVHQGWLTEDHGQFLLDDELDEVFFGHNTRTRIFNLSDLTAPLLIGEIDGATSSIDHNLYVVGDRAYEANYRSGLSVLDSGDAANGVLDEIGFFDIFPSSDSPSFNGAWSVYPFFASGVVVVSGIEQGLFVLAPGRLALGETNPGFAGEVNQWNLSGATPSGIVGLLVGRTAGSTPLPLPGCPGLTADISNARFAALEFADTDGSGTFSRNIRLFLRGQVLRFQAVDPGTCAVSNSVVTKMQ